MMRPRRPTVRHVDFAAPSHLARVEAKILDVRRGPRRDSVPPPALALTWEELNALDALLRRAKADPRG